MAPKTTSGPTGGIDIGELFKPFTSMAPDWTKAMQGLGGQGFGAQGKVWQDMLQSHQRNIESVTKLNNGVAQAMRQIAERQVELMRVTMSEMGAISSSMQKPGSSSAEAMSSAFDRALDAMREIAEIAEKANREALAAITERSHGRVLQRSIDFGFVSIRSNAGPVESNRFRRKAEKHDHGTRKQEEHCMLTSHAINLRDSETRQFHSARSSLCNLCVLCVSVVSYCFD